MSAETLAALSSAFRTGYSVGINDGYWLGVCAMFFVNMLFGVVAPYAWHLYKKWKSEAKLRAARRDFKEFERALPPPSRPAPQMPPIRNPSKPESGK